MDLYAELSALVHGFDAAGIDYALCGGLALAVHGRSLVRFTKFAGSEPLMLDLLLVARLQEVDDG